MADLSIGDMEFLSTRSAYEKSIRGEFPQIEKLTYAGSATEYAITLDRGTEWNIKRIIVVFDGVPKSDALIQAFRKASGTTANERNQSHADSEDVLVGGKYLKTGDTIEFEKDNLSTTPLRLYLDLGTASDDVFVSIEYDYE